MRGKVLMRRGGIVVGLLVAAATVAGSAPAASAQGGDPAGLALNIIPSGQRGLPGPGFTEQAELYNGLTPLSDKVTYEDLGFYFKSEALGTGTNGPVTQESVPYPGVHIERDRFYVPHVYSDSYDGGIFAAGWIAAEDRGALLQQARYNGRVAAIDAPGLSAINLILQTE